jgi:hypothetical protein
MMNVTLVFMKLLFGDGLDGMLLGRVFSAAEPRQHLAAGVSPQLAVRLGSTVAKRRQQAPNRCRRFAARKFELRLVPWADAHGYMLPPLRG